MRSSDWKYIRYFKRTIDKTYHTLDGTYGTHENYNESLKSTLIDEQPIYEELYFLPEDPFQQTNLAEHPHYENILNIMRARILELGKEALGDSDIPLTIPLEKRYESE